MTIDSRRKILKLLCFAAVGMFIGHAPSAPADSFPSRPIRLITPGAIGGSTDVISRVVSQKLAERLKQPIVVENRAGTGGTLGAAVVAKAPADGYTLLFSNVASNAIALSLYPKLPYEAGDFEHIAIVGTLPNALLVTPALPVKTLNDLISLAKASPGTLAFGSAGSGTSVHLSAEMLRTQAGIDVLHIPYKGATPAALQDLMSGRISYQFENVPTALSVIKSGKLRVLGTTGAQRSPMLPDVPTLKEQGLPNFVAEAWFGYSAPAKTPPEIVGLLNAEIRASVGDPAIQARLLQFGISPASYTPAQFREFVAADIEKWRVVVKASGARVE